MAKIALLVVGCILALGLAEACGVRPWHPDWNVCPPCGDVYHNLWIYCKQYPEDSPCQLCHLGRSSPQHTLLRHCLLHPDDSECVRFRPSRPIRGSGSRERRGSRSRERRRGSGSRERRRGSKSRERRRGSGSRERRRGSKSRERRRGSGSKEKYGKKCKK